MGVLAKIKILKFLPIYLVILSLTLYLPQTFAFESNGQGEGQNQAGLLPVLNTTGRTAEVNINTGESNYSLPLKFPPGRQGMEPRLSLNYSANAGNDWLGMGWSLGYAPIKRSTKKGVPLYTDTDTFEDAATGQDLVLVDAANQEYRSKIDYYVRYKKLTDGQVTYWLKYDKDGTIYSYGHTTDSRQQNTFGTFAWYLDSIKDVHNNTISFTYETFNGRLYPKYIDYTGTNGTDPQFRIEFVLGDRTNGPPEPVDTYKSYISKAKVELTKRLNEIQIKIKQGAQFLQKGKYALRYTKSPDTKASLLQSVTQHGDDNETAYPPVVFNYKSNAPSFSPDTQWGVPSIVTMNGSTPEDRGVRFADVNGDGLPDSVLAVTNDASTTYSVGLNNGHTFVADSSWNLAVAGATFANNFTWNGNRYSEDGGLRIVDVNGDGYADLVRPGAVYLNTKTGRWELSSWGFPFSFTRVDVEGSQRWAFDLGVRFADVNGDGLMDVVQALSESFRDSVLEGCGSDWSRVTQRVYLNNGSGWVSSSWSLPADVFVSNIDFLTRYVNNCIVSACHKWGGDYGARFADINGDGLTDIFLAVTGATRTDYYPCPGSDVSYAKVYINNGTTWELDTNWTGGSTFSYYFNFRRYYSFYRCADGYDEMNWNENMGTEIADVNGDNLPDIIQSYYSRSGSIPTTKYIALNTGHNWAFNASWSNAFPEAFILHQEDWRPDPPYFRYYRYNYDLGARLVDLNGDKRVDVIRGNIFEGYPTYKAYINSGQVSEASDTIKEVNNGIGGKTNYTYKPSTQFIDDDTDLPLIFEVVSRKTSTDRDLTTYTADYIYGGGLYDSQDKEFRGFKHVTITKDDGSKEEVWFKQDDVLKGKEYLHKWLDSADVLYSQQDLTWDSRETVAGKGTNFPYLLRSDERIYDGQESPDPVHIVKEFEYDDYGNTERVMDWGIYNGGVADGDEKDSRLEYTYNTNNWLLNRPKHKQLFDGELTQKNENWFYYDRHASLDDPPEKGDLTKSVDWLEGANNPQVLFDYDEYGNRISSTDANNHTTTTAYEEIYHAYPSTITNHVGHQRQYTYDPLYGVVLTETDPNNQTTEYQYDVFGRLTKVIQSFDSTEKPTIAYSYRHDVVPLRVISEQREQSGTDNVFRAWSYYDGFGRLIEVKKEAKTPGRQIISGATEYNFRDQPLRTWLPYEIDENEEFTTPDPLKPKTLFEYDPVGRLTRLTHPDNTFVTNGYLHKVLTVTDENGHQKQLTSDGQNRTVSVKEYNQGQEYNTAYAYDALNNLTSIVDHAGNQTIVGYDTLSRKTQQDDPDLGAWSYAYDAVGNLMSQFDARNRRTNLTYDVLNRITTKYYLSERTSVGYEYDNPSVTFSKGRLTKMSDTSGQKQFQYDQRGRVIKITKIMNGQPYMIEKAYDAMNRLITLTYLDGEVVNYAYNAQGLLQSIQSPETIYVSHVDYDAQDKITRIEYGNGAVSHFEYNPDTQRLTHLWTGDSALTLIQDLVYAYDNAGNVTSINDTVHNDNKTYGYDDLNHLTSALYGGIPHDYAYNPIGNLIEKDEVTYTYGENAGPHAVTSGTNGFQALYDNNGNMMRDNDFSYDYDSANKMTRLFNQDRSRLLAKYIYDGDGNRLKKIIYPQRTQGVPLRPNWEIFSLYPFSSIVETLFAFKDVFSIKDAEALLDIEQDTPEGGGGGTSSKTTFYIENLFEKEVGGTPYGSTTKHVFLGAKRIASKKDGQVRFYHSDHLNSTNIMTDSTGHLVSRLEYAPYGETVVEEGQSLTNYKFTNQELDKESSLYNYGARYYNPAIGRFVSADSIVPDYLNPQSLDRYSYVLNNPMKYVDPNGHFVVLAAQLILNSVPANWREGVSSFVYAPIYAFSPVGQRVSERTLQYYSANFSVYDAAAFASADVYGENREKFFSVTGQEIGEALYGYAMAGVLKPLLGPLTKSLSRGAAEQLKNTILTLFSTASSEFLAELEERYPLTTSKKDDIRKDKVCSVEDYEKMRSAEIAQSNQTNAGLFGNRTTQYPGTREVIDSFGNVWGSGIPSQFGIGFQDAHGYVGTNGWTWSPGDDDD